MVSDVTLCPAVCRFSNLLITVLLLNMKCQLTKGDFIAKKMKTRDINVMPSFNDFTVVNTAAGNSCCCMFAAIGHQYCCLLEPAQFQLLLKKFAKMHVSIIFN